jgi:quinoprotein glucose dehydrogenase
MPPCTGRATLTIRRIFQLGAVFAASAFAQSGDWPAYGNDPGGQRYSPLEQINKSNVARLRVAWTYHTGDISDATKYARRSAFETTPIMVNGTLYLSTAFNRVIALDPETAKSAGPTIQKSICKAATPKAS